MYLDSDFTSVGGEAFSQHYNLCKSEARKLAINAFVETYIDVLPKPTKKDRNTMLLVINELNWLFEHFNSADAVNSKITECINNKEIGATAKYIAGDSPRAVERWKDGSATEIVRKRLIINDKSRPALLRAVGAYVSTAFEKFEQLKNERPPSPNLTEQTHEKLGGLFIKEGIGI